jgi:hypothetical protein
MNDEDFLEKLWDRILSREPELILDAYAELPDLDQVTVLRHLEKMVSEEGWHEEQVRSAQAALDVLKQG